MFRAAGTTFEPELCNDDELARINSVDFTSFPSWSLSGGSKR
jgi:hypothetical protein